MDEQISRHRYSTIKARALLAILIMGVALALAFGNPYSLAWPLKCPLYWMTGLQCPLCGMQRATHELLHLHFAEAWELNAGFIVISPYFRVLLLGTLFPSTQEWKIVEWCRRDRTFFIVMGLFALWGIIRNIM
jgi:hypothetical protein